MIVNNQILKKRKRKKEKKERKICILNLRKYTQSLITIFSTCCSAIHIEHNLTLRSSSAYFSASRCLGRGDLGQPAASCCFVALWLTGAFC